MYLVVCYDITENRRRTRVRKVLRSYGESVQDSVFEADIDSHQLKRLQEQVTQLIDGDDRVRYYLLCEACVRRIEGTSNHPDARTPALRVF